MRRTLLAILASACFLALTTLAVADAVVTLNGRTVQGEITFENEDEIRLKTERYGELRFLKMNLKQIIRGSGTAGGFGGNTGGFGGNNGGGNNPFGGGSAGDNPFGGASGGAEGDDVSALWGGDSAGDNPFAPASDTQVASAAATSPKQGTGGGIPEFKRSDVVAPEVPFGWDAVVFGIPEDMAVQVKAEPSMTDFQAVSTDTNLRSGAEVMTADAQARLTVRTNKDIVRLPRHSHIELATLTDDNVTINLKRGKIWCEVEDRGGKGQFIVRTPNVTAGVQGTIFRVSDDLGQGVNVAVLDGSVRVASTKAQIATNVPGGKMVTVLPNGQISALMPLNEAIVREYNNWDAWADEAVAGLGGVGGGVAEGMIRDTAAQNAAWAGQMAAANYYISRNKLGQYIDSVADAFRRYAADTGHVPTTEEGFSVLRENMGNWPNYNGPYWDDALPPVDSWGRPLRYIKRISERSGNTVGIVYSVGEDNRDNEGSISGDIPSMILFNQIPAISENPVYNPERLLRELQQEQEQNRRRR
ncbi:FecR domain-containing protein [bacterium]|nr:FecR domain-containing protein [bacterium]